MRQLLINPELFDEKSIPADTAKLNAELIAAAEAGPDMWAFDASVVRQARRDGKSAFPLEPEDPNAEYFEIEGTAGPVGMRVIHPDDQEPRGVFLHIHGGGWVLGGADLQDQRLKQMANETGLDCISVEYRLAPEDPYPAGPDDCEAAALWLAQEGHTRFNTSFLAISGDSAGGHLSVNALLRLRDKHGLTPFHAAVLVAGAYDMNQTPSGQNFHTNLVLTKRDMDKFNQAFLQNGEDFSDPDISPINADLTGMPPAHFTVGTLDALLDDSVFMANRWVRFQPDTELDIYPGGCHVFQYFDHLEQSQTSRKAMSAFLNRLMDQA